MAEFIGTVAGQAASAGARVEVSPLRGWRDRAAFIDLPYRLHRSNPNWIPPLRRDMRQLIDRRHNPFFDHGDACFWVARRDGVVVGRLFECAVAECIGDFDRGWRAERPELLDGHCGGAHFDSDSG